MNVLKYIRSAGNTVSTFSSNTLQTANKLFDPYREKELEKERISHSRIWKDFLNSCISAQ